MKRVLFPITALILLISGSVNALELVGGTTFAAQKIFVAGSTANRSGFLNPSKEDFETRYPQFELAIFDGDIEEAVREVINENIDVAMLSRHVSYDEAKAGLVSHVIGWDAIAMIVNKSNPVNNLSIQELNSIKEGKITNWKDVGGEDKKITIICAVDGPAILGPTSDRDTIDLLNVISASAEKDHISVLEGAIGAISNMSVDDKVKVITIDDVAPSNESVFSNKYKFAQPLILLTKGKPSQKEQLYINFIHNFQEQQISKQKTTKVAKKLISPN